MAFTINQSPVPGGSQVPQQAVQPTAAAPGQSQVQANVTPTPLNNSPFLFVQYRGQQMPISAYVQIVLLLVAFLSVFLTVVLFGYSYYLQASIASKKEQLAQSDATFKTYPIKEMQRFNDKTTALQKLLKGYVSIRSPLKLLENVVEKQVYFNNFALTKKEGDAGYSITFNVVTTNYRNLIQQLDALGLPQYNKIAPGVRPDLLSSNGTDAIKVTVSTPVFVQGVLPDEIVFLDPSATTNITIATSTPRKSSANP